jgi:hypothetical protein
MFYENKLECTLKISISLLYFFHWSCYETTHKGLGLTCKCDILMKILL